jgi:outer membrane protein OmpA-like peptidoglycan-associated protein
MRRVLLFAFAIISLAFASLAFASVAFAQSDRPGSKDYPGITRMPGHYIDEYEESQFDSFGFRVTKGGQTTVQEIEGHKIRIHYFLKDNAPVVSSLQVLRNHQNAVRSAGGQVMYDSGPGGEDTTLRLTQNGKEVWISVEASNKNYWLTIVERQAMQQDVVMDAAAMANGLSSHGSVALYGIYFDTAKSDLKPESEPTLSEIAKLLKGKRTLKVFIVGHTDMVGDPAANLKLSQARAQSVINALVTKYGIEGSRLTAFGVGSYAPVASNKTEEGRAKNRRVELVEFATQ